MDLRALAELSHAIDRLALALADAGADEGRALRELQEVAAGQREAAALALAYALRRQNERGPDPGADRAVLLLEVLVARMGTIDLR